MSSGGVISKQNAWAFTALIMCRIWAQFARAAGCSAARLPSTPPSLMQHSGRSCISGVTSMFTAENRQELCYHLRETGNEKSTKICILQLFMFFHCPVLIFIGMAWLFPQTYNLHLPKKKKKTLKAIPSRTCRGILDSFIIPVGNFLRYHVMVP